MSRSTLCVLAIVTLLLGSPLTAQSTWGRRMVTEGGRSMLVDDRDALFRLMTDRIGSGDADEPAIYPTLGKLVAAAKPGETVIQSVAVLMAESKRFDDRLVATIDLLLERGWPGGPMGKAAFLAAFADALNRAAAISGDGAAGDEALARVWAARRLGGTSEEVPARVAGRASDLVAAFDANALMSKPIGFYEWTDELSHLFRQDRFLQQSVDMKANDGAWLTEASRVLLEEPALHGAYSAWRRVATTLSNPLAMASLTDLSAAPRSEAAFFPPSRSHEAELLVKLYGNRPIPDGHVFMDDLVAGIRRGAVDLTPQASSGWYDWQTWALEPLIRRSTSPEEKKVDWESGYAKHCEAAFRALLTQRRETHAKQLLSPPCGGSAGTRRVVIHVAPRLTVEPHVTLYRRTSESYAFVRRSLERLLGRDVLATTRLVSADGAVGETVLGGLERQERWFADLAALACREVGGEVRWLGQGLDEAAALRSADRAAAALSAGLTADDLAHDPRVMVPVGFDLGRKEVRCWAVVGVATCEVTAFYARPPECRLEPSATERASDAVTSFVTAVLSVPYEVQIECSLKQPLTRTELRKLCDACTTLDQIKKALGAVR